MAEKKSKRVEIKTKPTEMSVHDFINALADEQQRADCYTLVKMMQAASGDEPVIWSSSIIGFGNMFYKSEKTGREVAWLKIGFAPRKGKLSLYLSVHIAEHSGALAKLGKHKTGVGCLYINKLEDIDLRVLEEIVMASLKAK